MNIENSDICEYFDYKINIFILLLSITYKKLKKKIY